MTDEKCLPEMLRAKGLRILWGAHPITKMDEGNTLDPQERNELACALVRRYNTHAGLLAACKAAEQALHAAWMTKPSRGSLPTRIVTAQALCAAAIAKADGSQS